MIDLEEDDDYKDDNYIYDDYETDKRRFYKRHPNDKVWWVEKKPINEQGDVEYGYLEITFDKKKIYSLWRDYPQNMTKKEVKIFDEENPYWANAFKDRK